LIFVFTEIVTYGINYAYGGPVGRHNALVSVTVNRTLLMVLIVFLLVGVSFYGGYLLLRETTEISMPSFFQPPSNERLFMSMDGFRFAQSENGRITWRVDARNADLFENKKAQLKDMEIDFKNPDNTEARLFGDTGAMDTASGNASVRRISNDVKIVTSDGYQLTTNSLFWNAGDRVVWTADPFKLLGREIYLEGIGITAKVDMRTLLVKDSVKAVLQK